ncbi:MAG TPA: DUF1634 domain-containing protein [Planctomycetes bacterium]|nr:DUF1634 domain-containing protein [Planctomycetota bacterium]
MAVANDQLRESLEPAPEQVRYAVILEKGMYLGLACLFVTFGLYVFEAIGPYIPHEQLPRYWNLGVDAYLEQTGIEPGWAWLRMLGHGDFLNFLGIAVLAGVTVVCYAAILPILIRKRDYIYSALAVLEILVLAAAASGVISVGH